MSTAEAQLLSRIIRSGDISTPLNWGMTYEDFLTSECRAIFQHILSYYQMAGTSGAVLGPYAMQRNYPTFQLCDDSSMTMEALCTEVRSNRRKQEFQTIMMHSSELVQSDLQAALNHAQAGLSYLEALGSGHRTDVAMGEALGRILQKMELTKQGVDLSIGSWPWYPLQEATGGLQPDDYVVFYGRPKSKKTWILAYLIAWFFDQGKRLLIYTKEMTSDNIFMRVGAVMACIRYHEFRRAKLSQPEEEAIYSVWKMVHALRQQQPIICLSGKDAGDRGDTVPWLRAKMEKYKPDIAFIDGMYLLTDARGPKNQKDNARVQSISRDLRSTVLATGIPIIATIQANRKADENEDANLAEIAFSDSIGQDATLATRVISEKGLPTVNLVIGGSREFELDGFRIHAVPATNFTYAGTLTTADIQKAVANDTRDSDTAKGKKGKNGKKSAKATAASAEAPETIEIPIDPPRDPRLDGLLEDMNRSVTCPT